MLVGLVIFAVPAFRRRRLDHDVHERRDLRGCRARLRHPLRPCRDDLARPGRPAHARLLDRNSALVRDVPAVSDPAAPRRRDHVRHRHARRAAGTAPVRPLPRADHADVRGRRHDRAGGDRLPQRRRRVQGPLRDRCAHDQHAPRAAAVVGDRRMSRTTATPSSSAWSCSCSRSCTSPPSQVARGRRSARASRRRWLQASTSRSTSFGPSRSRRSSPVSPAVCLPRRSGFRVRSPSRRRTRSRSPLRR